MLFSKVRQVLFAKPRAYACMWSSEEGVGHDWVTWSRVLFPGLDTIARSAGSDISVHCRYFVEPGSREVKLPRLKWGLDSSKDWCIGAPGSGEERKSWRFFDLQVMSPNRGGLRKTGSIPDIYIQLKKWNRNRPKDISKIDQLLLFVISPDYLSLSDSIELFLVQLKTELQSSLVITSEMRVRLLNEMETIALEYISYRGIGEDVVPDPVKMAGKWECL